MAVDRVTEEDLATGLSHVLERVQDGETVAIERGGRVIAEIVPVAEPRGITLEEFFATYYDRPRPDDRFADDLEAIQAAQPMISDTITWRD
jgi:antitoxin (DNA-binding transcriptional repressor) of toxin-antitoxin stability system